MAIGFIFPVRDDPDLKSVPWGDVEPHRDRAFQTYGKTLERLYALGGLTRKELATLMLGRDVTDEDVDTVFTEYLPKAKEP